MVESQSYSKDRIRAIFRILAEEKILLVRWLFLRALGLVYLVAFLSLSTQILGLIGSEGIAPVQNFLHAIGIELDAAKYLAAPTLFWMDASDAALKMAIYAGIGCSVLVVLGILTFPALVILWVLYLSITNVGSEFLSFQWDVLLVEAGFLSIFFAPICLFERPKKVIEFPTLTIAPPIVVIWLMRFLVFRLMFSSGAVKLLSGDTTWRQLTALDFHYWTQPLPTPMAWYAAQLPLWFQHFSVVVMFIIELGVPFLIFASRKPRLFAGITIVIFQFLIAITGNYTFFNMLTIALCLTLFDDQFLAQFIPGRKLSQTSTVKQGPAQKMIAVCLVAILGCAGLGQILLMFLGPSTPSPFLALESIMLPFHVVNSYGLFAVMTTSREEIVVEGSDDAHNWREYEFKYKPGAMNRMPAYVEPLQPRLDWQMWFAALSDYQTNPWFLNFMARLLQGDKTVESLLAKNPFPDHTPRYVRALLYDYRFTDSNTRTKTGDWWKRELKGLYLPPISLHEEQ